MDLTKLVLLLLGKILSVEGLERVSTESLNLFFDKVHDITETLEVELTGSIALTARKALFVNLSSFALKAGDVFFNALFVRV